MTEVEPPKLNPAAAIRKQVGWAAGLLAVLILALGGAAVTISLAGAVIASGQIAVASDVKRIQHPTGGVVAGIRVKDGMHVRAGDVLITLDATAVGANAQIVNDALSELTAKEARLEAERDSRGKPNFPSELTLGSGSAQHAMLDENRLFEIRQRARTGAKTQLIEQREQVNQQISGYEGASRSKIQQIALIDTELAGVQRLFAQNLVPLARLNALERDAAQLRGDVAQLAASVAEAKGKISEIDVQMIQVDQNARAEAGSQLSDVQGQLSELRQKRVTAQQELKRVDIRAPQDGVVDRLAVHTVGGVIAPGEPIMVIVPDKDQLTVTAHIKPTDVDKVVVGRDAALRFAAFDQRTTPELKGRVIRVTAEAEADEKTGASFYVVTISVPAPEVDRLNMKLVPGMPVEAFISTDRRTIFSYLTKPLSDQLRRAFRE